jgi:hypothetical protein
LPTELLLCIFEIYLDLHSRSSIRKGRLAVLNVALTCRPFYHLIKHIAETEIQPQLKSWNQVELPTKKSLVALARRAACLCSLCDNRARYPTFSKRELFTNWLVCQRCDIFLLPKISEERLKMLYYIGENTLKSLPFVDHPGQRIYPWESVVRLKNEQLITSKPGVFTGDNSLSPSFSCQSNVAIIGITQDRILREIVFHWTGKEEIPDSPSTLDSILFHEFWYRFNPTSSIPDTPGGRRWRWGHIAKLWAASQQKWTNRPWSMFDFPSRPASYLLTPEFCSVSSKVFHADQTESQLYRRLFEIYPEILAYPDHWIKCTEKFDKWDDSYWSGDPAMCLARDLRKEWTPGVKGKVDEWYEFGLFKGPGKWDVVLVTDIPTANFLERDPPLTYRFLRCERVVVQNGSVKIKDPMVWRNGEIRNPRRTV